MEKHPHLARNNWEQQASEQPQYTRVPVSGQSDGAAPQRRRICAILMNTASAIHTIHLSHPSDALDHIAERLIST
jgi:hypothetical protein